MGFGDVRRQLCDNVFFFNPRTALAKLSARNVAMNGSITGLGSAGCSLTVFGKVGGAFERAGGDASLATTGCVS